MDSALSWVLQNYAKNLLLLPPFAQQYDNADGDDDGASTTRPFEACTSIEQAQQCPAEVLQHCAVILQFSAALLRDSANKNLYASVPIVADFLASADDDIADHAVSVLTALSLPPASHKQQRPDHQLHTTQLHQASNSPFSTAGNRSASANIYRTDVHDRLMATARAWGTRAMGLGLYATVTADDSVHGQGALPEAMGLVNFTYYSSSKAGDGKEVEEEATLKEITLSLSEMLVDAPDDSLSSAEGSTASLEGIGDSEHAASKKRRRVTSEATASNTKTNQKKQAKSTAELFFLAVEKVGGIHNISSDRWFSLLADIRLARAFHSQASRCAAVNRRLRALIAILNSHPSQEIMSGYFQAQPELCVEIVDLLRPVVSAANVSAASSIPAEYPGSRSGFRQDAIANLVGNSTVPFDLRVLAVEALTALVSRRDGSTGALSGASRSSSVLTELGVGKGQYLGLLPTLIRYSLASLGAATVASGAAENSGPAASIAGSAFDVGLAFVEATMAPPLPRTVQVERALRFIDRVLTLTLSVIGTPTGTSSLVDCGLIPALLSTVSMDPESVVDGLLLQERSSCSLSDVRRVKGLMRFVAGQAVQILEGAAVTHSNALTAFHDLQGVEILTARLSKEMAAIRRLSTSTETEDDHSADADGDVEMEDNAAESGGGRTVKSSSHVLSSQRVLLYSILTCLTVIFHQESSSSGTPTGGAQLKKKDLTDAIVEIMGDVKAFGGHLTALIATLLSDIMNSDPHVVRYVHECGIAASFLNMLIGENVAGGDASKRAEPVLPPVPELIMAIPNVISALALTEDGAKAVAKTNPFPALLRLFHHPDYAMPRSRCLLNEMTSIIGTGLDEIMRHVERLKQSVLAAIVNAMVQVADEAQELISREEESCQFGEPSEAQKEAIDTDRSCLIQYVLNFGQLLEQILHNEDHCDPFVEAGGLDALLRLFPLCMPSSVQFLPYVSCLSAPSVSTLHHSTTEETLSIAMKCIDFRYNSLKLIQKLEQVATKLLDDLDESEQELLDEESGQFSLDILPQEPLYRITRDDSRGRLLLISKYLRRVGNVQWVTALLANAIKAACQRNGDSGSIGERDWTKELATDGFGKLVARLASVHRVSLFEVCRVRTEDAFETRERERLSNRNKGLRYRLRIVCPEGAVVRDGIEIDSCANVGNMEMGDIVDSFDRCINSSGIMRYRTKRGWVSEMTRGHGREPIAEVISLWEDESSDGVADYSGNKRKEAGIPDLRSVAVGVLARGQTGFAELYGALSKLVIQSVRTSPFPSALAEGHAGSLFAATIANLARTMREGLSQGRVAETALSLLSERPSNDTTMSSAGAAMYLGCLLNILHVGLFDDKRERRMVNFPLLVNLVAASSEGTLGLFDAFRFVFKHGLSDFSKRALTDCDSLHGSREPTHQRVDRSVAASFPPLLSLLRKLVATPLSSSPAASAMGRMKWKDVSRLLDREEIGLKWTCDPEPDSLFQPESFVADLHFSVSKVAREVWSDDRLLYAPPFLVHPIATLIGELLLVLEDASKKKSSSGQPRSADRIRLSELMRQRLDEEMTEAAGAEEEFEPSEESITRLTEMGFSRDHAVDALDSVRSNQVELAMDYALSNPPDPAAVERRRLEREARAQRRAGQQNASASQDAENAGVVEAAAANDEAAQEPEPAGGPGDGPAANDEAAQEPEPAGGSGNGPAANDEAASEPEPADGPANGDAMDIEQPRSKEAEKNERSEAEADARNSLFKAELAAWIESVPKVACGLLDRMPRPSDRRIVQVPKQQHGEKSTRLSEGDAEAEALTVVLCSFMLDLCQRHAEERSGIAAQVFARLKAKLSKVGEGEGTSWFVPDSSEAGVAALCHAAVLVTRALPKTRLLVLKEGIVRPLISCVQSFVSATIDEAPARMHGASFPLWMAPSLLLLDIMAQPLVAFSDDAMIKSISEDSPDDEFCQVQKEHKEQVSELFSKSNRWFTAPSSPSNSLETGENASRNPVSGSDMDVDNDKGNGESRDAPTSPFSSIPAYFPLLPLESSGKCLEVCHSLLGMKSSEINEMRLSPGVAQSTMLLLLRLLRTPSVATLSLQSGVAEALLGLPKESSFTGSTGLVTLIFRRLLEDETTLQAAMETEIRSIVSKLHAKKNSVVEGAKQSVPLAPFVEAITPLLCRDPASFLKALSLSVLVEAQKPGSDETTVTLLSPAERSQRIADFADSAKGNGKAEAKPEDFGNQKRAASTSSKPRAKSQTRGSRRGSFSKKAKKDKSDAGKSLAVETPATHIASLLIASILSANANGLVENDDDSFLWTGDLLEILADLVLAVPACASAVHNYRPHRSKDKARKVSMTSQIAHALPGCPSPPKTFVTFLLHGLLPQDRWTIRHDLQVWVRRNDSSEKDSASIKLKKKRAFRVMKLSQSAARVLIALVVRPGEGRKRVVADLVFALSGGNLGHGAASSMASSVVQGKTVEPTGSELHALYAWGELCLGLAAPRSNGKNLELIAALSIENLRLMLEHGMVHSLLYAMNRVTLSHPMATSTYKALLLPLEVLTRANVNDSVKTLVKKELQPKEEANQNAADPTAAAAVAAAATSSEGHNAVEGGSLRDTGRDNHGVDSEVDYDALVHAEGSDMDEDGSHDIDEEMEDAAGSEGGESPSSEESGGETSDEESEDEEMEEDGGSDNEDSDEGSSEEVEDEGGWDVDYDNAFGAGGLPVRPVLEADDDGTDRIEDNEDDAGWTRIESNGFGGMFLTRRGGGLAMNNDPPARSRGFIDAAEAMIGTLLRNGDISGSALAEIEGTLGIRIVQGGRIMRGTMGSDDNEGGDSLGARALRMDGGRQADRGRRDLVTGTLPHVNQRNQPDVGYSSFTRSGQWAEISSMEYVFGGPCVTGGSRNYDVTAPIPESSDSEAQPTLHQLDLELFPGGPVSAASSRTRHALHPLLCGVDLPPVNSLVSDLLPHGVRATRLGQMTTRHPGDWTNASFASGGFLVSTSNGNIVRSNRAPTGSSLGGEPLSRNFGAGPLGWTDDGLPVDATVDEFRFAFEVALGHSARLHREPEAQGGDNAVSNPAADNEGELEDSNQSSENQEDAAANSAADNEGALEDSNQSSENQEDAAANPAADNEGELEDSNQSSENQDAAANLAADNETLEDSNRSSENQEEATHVSVPAGGGGGEAPENHETSQPSENASEQGLAGSEGDGMATSLVAELRLSPRSEPEETHEESLSNVPIQAAADSRSEEPAELSPTEDSPMDESVSQGEGVPTDSANDTGQQAPEPGDAAAASHGENLEVDAENGTSLRETAADTNDDASPHQDAPNDNGLVCPPDIELDVFNSLPREMQQECVDQYSATRELAAQLDGSSLDPEVLAALPDEMRREVIEQDRQERRMREQQEAPADPTRAEEMDNASFIASLAPDLREEILLQADDALLSSLPPGLMAEAQILRDRASARHGRALESNGGASREAIAFGGVAQPRQAGLEAGAPTTRRKQRSGKLKVEQDRAEIVFVPESLPPPIAVVDLKTLIRLLYMLSPVRPKVHLQKMFYNLCINPRLRSILTTCFVKLLHEDGKGALAAIESLAQDYKDSESWRRFMDDLFSKQDFPPQALLGAAPGVPNTDAYNVSVSASLLRRREGLGTAASMAANLPKSEGNSASSLPPIVASRLIDTLFQLCKSPRFCLHTLICPVLELNTAEPESTCFDKLLELLSKPMFTDSSGNLESLLTLLELAVSPLSHMSKHKDDTLEISQRDIDAAAASGREYVDVPRVEVSQARLKLLCSILRVETCRDAAFAKVNTIIRRLCRVETNRGYVLAELASVAHALGGDALRDLKALRIRMDAAVAQHQQLLVQPMETEKSIELPQSASAVQGVSSSVTLSTSTSELKLLRVLQTLQALCNDGTDEHGSKKSESSVIVTEELVHLLRQMDFDELWDELSSCLKVVQVLEGVKSFEEEEQKASEDSQNNDEDGDDDSAGNTKKLRNSAAGLLTRFLPSIEAFFVANGSATRPTSASQEGEVQPGNAENLTLENLVGGERMMEFVTTNKVLLNALIRNTPGLVDKRLRALVQVPRLRVFLDFDVKRQWFKTQVRRLRQQAARRHGSLRLLISRKSVFEDAYHQLQPRNADEMRGRLHITFRDEAGVDAGGLSREFFGILAKEMFNPNYALFTSTEDGCTFQPNPNSAINPDHLSYFRFVGRVVGKAVVDGFLLDAHFTRSLYKHMLGMDPTHHDMEAIDPDYYRNLKTILEYNLADIGLELTFSTEDHSFGRNQVIDLIPDGRKIAVTEDNKEEYVRKVCQYRMTTSIQSQIKAYLSGFFELVSPELVAVFTPRELELLISGLPDIDVTDLKQNTDYVGWRATDKEIGWFWNVMFSLSRNEKAAFLQFVTGSSKVPLAGFSELQGMRGIQKFSIHKVGGTKGSLMSAHTCFNSLDLPTYESEEEMREKLLLAINEGGGAFMFA